MSPARLFLGLAILALASPTSASSIGTVDIVQKTTSAALACTQWRATGMCFWLRCSWFSCDVETSLKVGHYNPDLVVSSYNRLGDNPWQEIRRVLGRVQRQAAASVLPSLSGVSPDSAGNRSEGTRRRDHKNLIFRDADAIGPPALDTVLAALPSSMRCASQASSFMPYFLSGIDALSWRNSIPESLYPASLIPGLREVGSWPLLTWGSVYPRTGWAIQAEEPKAAALTAQRAGDIVTRRFQPHLYIPLSGPSAADQQVWPPGPLLENDAATGTWQMLMPVTDDSCTVFGDDDRLASWANGRVDPEGDYVWNLWRPYQCCQREGQLFLGDINWLEYP